MRCTDGNEHAGVADFETAQAVEDGHAVDGEVLVKVSTDFSHLRKRHGFIGFIFKVQGRAAMRLIPHKAIKGDDCSVLIGADMPSHCCQVDRRAAQLKPILFDRFAHRWRTHPPLTGGRKAISSPAERGVSQAANSSFLEATSEARKPVNCGKRAAYHSNRSAKVAPAGISTASSVMPVNSRTRPKKSTFTRRLGETWGTQKL